MSNQDEVRGRLRELLEAGRAVVESQSDPRPGDDPIGLVRDWHATAEATGILLAESVALSTTSGEGHPSCRIVLLKGIDDRGFRFFTNYESRKARELEANPRTAMTFHWAPLERQIRIEGTVERLSKLESFEYYASRPHGSRLGAWASQQSRPLDSREALIERVREYEEEFKGGDVPLPPHWGGYRVIPSRIEFWQGRPSRLHDRWVFSRDAESEPWTMEMLQP